MKALLAVALLAAAPAFAKMVSRPISYEIEKAKFEGVLLFDDAGEDPAAGPGAGAQLGSASPPRTSSRPRRSPARSTWCSSPTCSARPPGRRTRQRRARAVGALKNDRPADSASGSTKALEALLGRQTAPLAAGKVGAVGFCFGGTAALELARSGAKLNAVVSIHGGLGSPTPADAKAILGSGARAPRREDPFVPPEEVAAFEDGDAPGARSTAVVAFGNAVHSFTDPRREGAGEERVQPEVARRAVRADARLFAEAFGRLGVEEGPQQHPGAGPSVPAPGGPPAEWCSARTAAR